MILRKKVVRDILSNKGSYLACLVLIVIGLMVFVSFSIANENLKLSKDTLYEEQSFAHGFAELVSMPERDLEKLSRVEGVREVSGRVVKEVRVNAPERDESVYLKLVSLDLADPARLNDARLLEGNQLTDGEMRAWLDEPFVDAHELELGGTIEVIAAGRAQEITLEGIAISPEFVYLLRTETQLYPNPDQFGVAFLPLETMWKVFPDMQGRVNNVVFTLQPGASYDRVEDELELELEAYGLRAIYPREEQTSHFLLKEEIEGIELMSTFLPLIFLAVAGFIILILLKRLVEQQRTQIGILKAFGYTNREVLLHYLSYPLILAIIGGVVGSGLGMALANPLTTLLYDMFKLPEIYVGLSPFYLGLGILLCLVVMGFGGYLGCKSALRLEPAEAMRPPAPVSGRKNILERMGFFTEMLTVQGKMAVRNLGRHPIRSAFMFFGIMIGCALVGFTWSLVTDALPTMMLYQYEEVETYDAKVRLAGPLAREPVQRELEALTETTRVEPIAEVPVTLSHRWREEDILLLGLTRDGRLYNIRDSEGNRVIPSDKGLILSQHLAESLEAEIGGSIKLESPFLDTDDPVEIRVIDIIPQYIGMNAYMELAGLEEMLGQQPFATSLLVDVAGDEPGSLSSLRDRYWESDLVAGIDGREDQIRAVEELFETQGRIFYLFVIIGILFSFAVIYVSSFIILSERNRELASMRVLGMSSGEVLSVITFEQWFISFFAVLVGIPLAQLIQRGFGMAYSTDMYQMPADVSVQALFIAVLITIFSIWIAQRFALYKIDKLDLVEVLKSRE